jgi:hypothetical protein
MLTLKEELQVDFMVRVVAHSEPLLVVVDVKDVIEDRLFDCLINLKDKYDKCVTACLLQSLIYWNEFIFNVRLVKS